jgi:hypothetical protein
MATYIDFESDVEKRARPRRTAEIRQHGTTNGPQIEQECISEVVNELLAQSREQFAAMCLISRDYKEFWKDIPTALGTQSLLVRIAAQFEERGDIQSARSIWHLLYSKRKAEFAVVLPQILNMRGQLKKGIHLDRTWAMESEEAFAATKEYVLAATDPYISLLNRRGLKSEAEWLANEIAAIRTDRAPSAPSSTKKIKKLDDAVFWELIEEALNATGSGAELASHLTAQLASLPTRHIIQFQKLLHQKMDQALRWDLWAVASIMMRDTCSDDSFEYFRAWLISRGRRVFEACLRHPEVAAQGVEPGADVENEPIQYAAFNAYIVRKRGDSSDFWEKTARKEPAIRGKAWTLADLPKLLPNLCKRFRRP